MTEQSRYFHAVGGRRTSIEAPGEDDESVEQAFESHTPQAPVEEPDPDPAEHPPVDEPEHPRPPRTLRGASRRRESADAKRVRRLRELDFREAAPQRRLQRNAPPLATASANV